MSKLGDEISGFQVKQDTVQVWWLGGSGFVFKTAAGTQICIDPYLSNSVESIFGVQRDFPPPLLPEEARPTAVISTHWHEDHLDPGTLPVIARHSPDTIFYCPPSAVPRALSWMMPRDRVKVFKNGDTIEVGGVTITGGPARHEAGLPGWETPDAMSVILDFDGLKVMHTGDTEYCLGLRAMYDRGIDVIIPCINGVGGNMNAHEAALLTWTLGCKVGIPCHHRIWKGFAPPMSTLDPNDYASTYKKLGGTGEIRILEVGQGTTLQINSMKN